MSSWVSTVLGGSLFIMLALTDAGQLPPDAPRGCRKSSTDLAGRCSLALCLFRGRMLVLGLRHRVRGGGIHPAGTGHASELETDDTMWVKGGNGPVHDCSQHEEPPCRESDLLLWQSAASWDVKETRRALRNGASVNARNEHDSQRAALHYVASSRNASCTLCGHPAPADDDATPCTCRGLIISELIHAGADVSLPCALGARAMHLAAATGAFSTVKALLHLGGDADVTDNFRRRPLHYAAVISFVCCYCCCN